MIKKTASIKRKNLPCDNVFLLIDGDTRKCDGELIFCKVIPEGIYVHCNKCHREVTFGMSLYDFYQMVEKNGV